MSGIIYPRSAVYNNALTNCAVLLSPRGPSLALRAIHLVPRLRRLSGLCSSNVSDTANRLRKTRKKKSSAVPLFRSGHMSAICARLSKGKAGVQRGRENAGVPSFLPLRRAPHVPALRRAQLPLNRRRKSVFNKDFTRKNTLYLNLTNSRFCILQNFRKIIL